MANGIDYRETPEFQNDVKRLSKKYPTLREDLEMAKKAAIELFHVSTIDNHSIFPITDWCTEDLQICKLKKFACKALKGKGVMSGIRVIYAFHVNALKVDFIEMYYKGDREDEDRKRIKAYLDNR